MNSLNINKTQKGFSLVELLVGMVISLFVASAAITYLVSSSRNLTEKTGIDLVQENTRFALEVLTSNIRLAGLINAKNTGDSKINPLFIGAVSNVCAATLNANVGDADASSCNLDNANNTFGGIVMPSDRIAVQRVTNRAFQTCSDSIFTPFLAARVVTVFWAGDLDGDGISSLYCQTYIEQAYSAGSLSSLNLDGTPIPLVDGIEMLQVQYGIDTDALPDGDIDTYQSLPYLVTNPGLIDDIRSVKIGLLVSPGQAIASEQNSDSVAGEQKTYRVLDGYYQSAVNDRVRRQATSTTIFLPNKAN